MDRLHVAGLAGQVHRYDHLRQAPVSLRGRQLAFQGGGAEIGRLAIDIDEIDVGAAIAGAVGRGDEADRAGPDQVAGTDAERQAGNVKRAGGAVDGDRVCRAAVIGNRRLEARHDRALRQPIRAQDFHDRVDILLADGLPAVGDHAGTPPATWAAINSRNSLTVRKCGLLPLS